MSISPRPKLGWNQIQRHSIIKCLAVPQSGAGLIPILTWISDTDASAHLPEDVREAWKQEFAKLKLGLEECQLTNQLTQWDKLNKVWQSLDELQNAVVQTWVTQPRYRDLTWILLLHICHCSVKGTVAQHQFVRGLIQLCKSARSATHYSEWSEIWPYLHELPVDDAVLQEFDKPVHLEFLTEVKRIREAPLDHPRVMVTVDSLLITIPSALLEPVKQKPEPAQPVKNELPSEAEDPGEEKAPKYSIKPWANAFTAKAEFATRDERLGLPTWSDLPDEHVLAICRACASRIPDGNHQSTLSAIAILSLVTGLNIEQTLELPIQSNSEIQLDTGTGSIIYESSLLFDSKLKASSEKVNTERFRIPLSQSLASLLKEWSEHTSGAVLRDIVPGMYGGKADEYIVSQVEKFLKQQGDPNFRAWPSKWAGSGAKCYLRVLKSEMLSAICSLSPQLCPPSALYYFHPTLADLQKACEKVYLALGLGPAVVLDLSSAPQPEWAMATESLKDGWSQLIGDYLSGCKTCLATTPSEDGALDQILANFSQVAIRAAAIVTFLHGGRGSKTEEMTWQSLLLHDTITHLHDKNIDDGRGSRLIPKPEQARRLLDWFLLAQSATTQFIVRRVTGTKHKEWRQLSTGLGLLDAPLFNHVVLEAGVVRKVPVESAHVMRIANDYFGAPRNFMRHAIATAWPRVCEEDALLKVVTGHGSITLELPNAYSSMAPVDIIHSAGIQLQEVLETWIPISSIPKPPRKPDIRFDNLGLRRLMKGYGQYRRHFTESAQATYLSKWHLTATKLVEYLRTALISDATTRTKQADLVLHLLLIDLIHSEADLNAVLAHPRFTVIEGGYALAIERHGSNGLTVIPLQAPTSVIVKAAQVVDPVIEENSGAIWAEVRSWLKETLKTCSWARVIDETTQEAELLAQVFATVSLYADLHLPSSGQFAYEHTNNCVLFESTSALSLLAGDKVFATGAASIAMCRPPKPVVGDGVSTVISAVREARKRSTTTGPKKSDLNLYREALAKDPIAEEDSWGGVLNRCIEHNQHLPASSKGGRIEFSSTDTYLATIVHALAPWVCTRPSEMTEEDFAHWSKRILSESREQTKENSAGNEKAAERPEVTHARWFFKSMRALGFPIPDTALIEGFRKFQPQKPGRVVHISNEHCEAALKIVQAWNALSELDQLRAKLVMYLLREQPLRWGEVTYLQPMNISVLGDYLLVCANRYNHIKSDDSWRYLPLTMETAQLYRKLSERIADATAKPLNKVFLFVDEVNGEVDATRARTLHDQIQTALRFVTHNNETKIHNLRAITGSRMCFDSWEATLENWRSGVSKIDTHQTPALRESVYSVERSRRSFGHSSQQTSAYYYLYPAIFARQVSTSRLLYNVTVPSEYLAPFEITPAAIKKAVQRDATLGSDKWAYLARKMKLEKLEQVGPHPDAVPPPIQPPNWAQATDQKVVKYVGLRLLDGSKDLATRSANLDAVTTTQLESLIDRIDSRQVEQLRKRAGGRINSRTARADIEYFNSTYFDELWRVFGKASDKELASLFGFLNGRGNVGDWKERLIELGDRFFAPSGFKVELILKMNRWNPVLAAELSAHDWLELGPAARDQGVHPSAKLFLGQDANHIARSHQWTTAKIFVHSLQQVRSHFSNAAGVSGGTS